MSEPISNFRARKGSYEDNVKTEITKRLIISWHLIPETDLLDARWMFVARLRCDDTPRVIAHATVWDFTNFLEWLEVDARHRRQGIATEFRAAIEEMIGADLRSCDASEEGAAFRRSLGLPEDE